APDLNLLSRYLHSVLGALGIAGLWMAAIGRYQLRYYPEREETAAFLVRNGLIWASIATLINIFIGFGYLGTIAATDPERLRAFMGNGILFVGWSISIVTGVLALIHLFMALLKPEKPGFIWGGISLMALTLLGMVMGRSLLRMVSLENAAH